MFGSYKIFVAGDRLQLVCGAGDLAVAGWLCVLSMVGDLLPQLAAVQVERVEVSGDLLRITARTGNDALAECPGCGQVSDWVHSRYVRHVADEAVGGRAVMIDLSVRRLYCENPACEQVTGLTQRYQRRTPALQTVVDAVAVALAGSAGVRLLGVLHHVLTWASVLNCLVLQSQLLGMTSSFVVGAPGPGLAVPSP
ncbi:transposase family protein [Streptomyces sp. NPDC059718]